MDYLKENQEKWKKEMEAEEERKKLKGCKTAKEIFNNLTNEEKKILHDSYWNRKTRMFGEFGLNEQGDKIEIIKKRLNNEHEAIICFLENQEFIDEINKSDAPKFFFFEEEEEEYEELRNLLMNYKEE
ncbi:hypothetical protein [Methanobrevibacter sp. DSM 116169]|uniref:hypothetical protein n=1 Tax=Methanobrevibacter sp. DSM 116169 TaxID=3242727 RepID=UPI0038FC4FCD